MKNLFIKLKEDLNSKSIVERIISAFLFTSMFTLLISYKGLTSIKQVFDYINIITTILVFVISIISLTFLNLLYKDTTKFIMIFSTFILFITSTNIESNSYVMALMTMVLFLEIIYSRDSINNLFNKIEENKKLTKIIAISIITISTLFFVLFVGLNLIFRVLTHNAPNFDYGIYTQMFENMRTTFLANTTVERDYLVSHLLVHASFIWYLILPIYMILPFSWTLNFIQVLVVASAIIPMILLAKKNKFSSLMISILVSILLFYPYTSTGMNYDIHENIFLLPLLLYVFYYIEKENILGISISSFLVLLVKEDAGIYIAFIAIYLFFKSLFEKNKKMMIYSPILLVFSVLYFVLAFTLLTKYGPSRDAFGNRYSSFINGTDDSLFTIIEKVIKNPMSVIYEVVKVEKIPYIINMLLPLLFMPFISKHYERLILIGPSILIVLMTSYPYQYNMHFQYSYGVAAIFIYLMLKNLSEIDKNKIYSYGLTMLLSSILFFVSLESSVSVNTKTYKSNKDKHREVTEYLESIDENKIVSANTYLIADLRKVDTLYETYYTSHLYESDYIIFDMRYVNMSNASSREVKQIKALELRDDYVVTKEIEGYLLVYEKVN